MAASFGDSSKLVLGFSLEAFAVEFLFKAVHNASSLLVRNLLLDIDGSERIHVG